MFLPPARWSVLLCWTEPDSEVYVATQVSSLLLKSAGRYPRFSIIKNLPSFGTELILEEKFKAGSQWRVGAFCLNMELQTAILWLFSLSRRVETLVTKNKNLNWIHHDISIIRYGTVSLLALNTICMRVYLLNHILGTNLCNKVNKVVFFIFIVTLHKVFCEE